MTPLILAAATIYLSPVVLVDSTPKTPGRIIVSAVTEPQAPRGTVLFDCAWKRDGKLAYSDTDPCPDTDPLDAARALDAAPPVTPVTPVVGSWSKPAPRKTDVDVDLASTAYTLSGGDAVRIADVRMGKGYAFIQHAKAKPLTDLLVERVDATCTRKCVLLFSQSSGTIIRNSRFRGSEGYDYPYGAGIQLAGYSHDVLIENVDVGGFYSTRPKRYPNADAMSSEKPNYNVTIRNSSFHDATDACLDLKSQATLLDNISVARCNKNLRVHAKMVATNILSRDPRSNHIDIQTEVLAPSAELTITGVFTAIGGGTLINVPAGQSVTFAPGASCDLSRWTGTKKQTGTGQIIWGKGC